MDIFGRKLVVHQSVNFSDCISAEVLRITMENYLSGRISLNGGGNLRVMTAQHFIPTVVQRWQQVGNSQRKQRSRSV